MDNIWFIAAIWMGLALVASLISIRVGISVALIEIVVGVAAGNIHFGDGQQILRSTDWTNFLAMLGSGVLTFLAGAEIDPVSLRANLAREHGHRHCGVSAAVRRRVAVRAVRSRLAAASGANRRHRALHDFRGGGLCRDD